MPVQVFPSTHGAEPFKDYFSPNASDALRLVAPSLADNDFEVLRSSFSGDQMPAHMMPRSNGLMSSILHAYSSHHHLRLRPDDLWITILTQFSSYVNRHAEELRGKFVSHEGKKLLKLTYPGTRHTFDFGIFATDMGHLLQENVVDPELREWMMPDFTTTERQDVVVASIIMMGSLQKYFDYMCRLTCGIPSVTLLGEREDYEKLLHKVEKFADFGSEPTIFGSLLKPVISRMISTFDDPEDPLVIDFWQKILHVNNQMSGVTRYSGWATAFSFWDEKGKSHYRRFAIYNSVKMIHERGKNSFEEGDLFLFLDGALYHHVDSEYVAPAWTTVPVLVDDNGVSVNTDMIAGSVGIVGSRSENMKDSEEFDTMQPQVGWWIVEYHGAAKKHDEL